MAAISSSIANLINGVSQQSPSLRLATQCEEQINTYPTVVEGLKKRPPRIYVGSMAQSVQDSAFTHFMNRDTQERYYTVISDGDLRVFDANSGEERTVNFPEGKAYLQHPNPRYGFRAVTVADFTFITNRSVVTEIDPSVTSPTRPFEAIIPIKAGNYGRWYRIFIDGSEVASFRPGDGVGENPEVDVETVDTTNIAKALGSGTGGVSLTAGNTAQFGTNLEADLPSGFTWNRIDDLLHIVGPSDFTIRTEDGFAEQSMYALKDETQNFSRMPTTGPEGFVMKVYGSEENDLDHYFVQFNGKVWRECPEPGVQTRIVPTTMPHTLVSNADGTFTFSTQTWEDRVSGDEEIVPPPSFIGRTVSDVTFHKNRLGFLSDETFVASRSGDFFNFWRTTALQILDDDPIDVDTTHDKVSILNFAVPWANDLFLFSDQTQFALESDNLLTPKTVSIDPTTEFESSTRAKPVSSGRYIYFAADRGDHSSFHEYYLLDDYAGTYDTNDITGHVPSYIPTGIFKVTTSASESILAALSEETPNTIYVYSYYWGDRNEKLQSAWGKWEIEEGSTILNVDIVNSEMFLLVRYAGGQTVLERIPVDPAYTDPDGDYATLLDRRVHSEDLTGFSYDEDEDTTTFTLPYAADEIEVATEDGRLISVESVNGSEVVVQGDLTDNDFWAGVPYEMYYRFSEFFIREEATGGGIAIKTGGRIQLRYLTVVYNETAHFKVHVTAKNRQTYSYTFTGRQDGDSANVSGVLSLSDGEFRVPVMSNSRGTRIEITNRSPFPSKLISAAWTANYVNRTKTV